MPNPDVAATVGKALFDAPMGDMIVSMGMAIANAQTALDMNSIKVAQMMTGSYVNDKKETVSTMIKFDGEDISLLELGFTPSFYQFVETTIELKMSVSMSSTTDEASGSSKTDLHADAAGEASWGKVSGNMNVSCASVNASYASKFQYSAEGSSVIRTRLVPVPPPALLEERIRRSLDKKYAARKPV